MDTILAQLDAILAVKLEETDPIRIVIRGVPFTWNETKYRISKSGHKVDFKKVAEVYFDVDAADGMDQEIDKETGENRFSLIGMPFDSKNIIYFVYVERIQAKNGEDIMRIVTARKATPKEEKKYGRNKRWR